MGLRKESAIKQHRQSLKRRARNRYVISTLRTKIKKFDVAINEQDLEKSRELLKDLSSAFDKASTKGVLHKKNSSRNKSRYSKKLQGLINSKAESVNQA